MSRFRYVILPRLLLALSTLALLAALFLLWVSLERPMPTIALACAQAGPANGFTGGGGGAAHPRPPVGGGPRLAGGPGGAPGAPRHPRQHRQHGPVFPPGPPLHGADHQRGQPDQGKQRNQQISQRI